MAPNSAELIGSPAGGQQDGFEPGASQGFVVRNLF